MTLRPRPRIISIEGNIGAGKTTFLNILATLHLDDPGILILREPVDQWSRVADTHGTVLEHLYRDPGRHAFAFQVLVLHTMKTRLKEAMRGGYHTIIMERSVGASRHVFGRMLHAQGNMTDIEHQIYEQMCDDKELRWLIPDEVMYLDVPVEECLTRVRARGRPGEEPIDAAYLKACERFYREWLWPIRG